MLLESKTVVGKYAKKLSKIQKVPTSKLQVATVKNTIIYLNYTIS
jgi:hypothetical protein